MNRYFIAVCDDEEFALSQISGAVKKEFEKSGMNVDITVFNEPKLLLELNRTSSFDVIFLDIDMPKLDGIETARIIKKQNPESLIIFVTGKDELVYKSFEVHPFGFIRKLKLKEEISSIVEDIIKELSRNDYMLNFKIEGIHYKLLIDEIAYIESKGNYIIINTTDGLTYKYKDSINKKEMELSEHGFVRTHEKYLVNLKYIFKINKSSVTVIQNYNIPVSRSRMNALKEGFLNYYGRMGSGGI
ncbi:LytTR family DNA-binding domain-containing protein [Sedimentibacter sp.]|uniref:LytR/AlgR family response regulator transcription factor n=1 Tax=Sedimentibacter sp. TaxID=1960295 RepID=UPI0028974EE8|nr:LytTR family DNA-binding domain-containing protein [Sedimentibacter sp.]